jgi:hypothetical protein
MHAMRGNGETTRSGESNTNSAARRRDFLKAVGGVGVSVFAHVRAPLRQPS